MVTRIRKPPGPPLGTGNGAGPPVGRGPGAPAVVMLVRGCVAVYHGIGRTEPGKRRKSRQRRKNRKGGKSRNARDLALDDRGSHGAVVCQ
jgi:hypothetical protein